MYDVADQCMYKNTETVSFQYKIINFFRFNYSDPTSDFFGMKFDNVLSNFHLMWDVGLYSTEHAFNDRNVAAFMNRSDLHFDVVVLEQFFHDSWLPFAHKFKAPIVTIATLGHANYIDHAMGFLTPWAFVPHNILTFNDDMSFFERLCNVYWGLVDASLRKYSYMARMQQMAEKYFTGLDGEYSHLFSMN